MSLLGSKAKLFLQVAEKVGRTNPMKKYDPYHKPTMRALQEEAENSSKKYLPKKMKHGGMTCRGKGAATKGANYKG